MFLSDKNRQKIAEILASEPGIELAYLYGSYASGMAHEDSDVDIGIVWKKQFPNNGWKTETGIALKLGEAIGKDCDVRIINSAPIYFVDQVVNKGALVFASSHEAKIEFEARAIMSYLDYKPVFDLYDEYREKRLERGDFGVKYHRNIIQDR